MRRPPVKPGLSLPDIGEQHRRISWTGIGHHETHLFSDDLLGGLDQLEHARSMAGTKIEAGEATRAQLRQREAMRFGQVLNGHEIADAAAIVRPPTVAEHGECGPLA